ncbi:MAG: YigZ family protein [Deltaproteobacteria bacterium]|nr:MAG: YigZ family protein [Deltaproteobacteria bacterium]
MKTLNKIFVSKFEEKRSIFLAHLAPYSHLKPLLSELRQRHPKARHFVSAVRFFDENLVLNEHFNDDGEPKKTSGLPMLNVLSGADLINVCAINVRYFGGIKLGTGGLVRAYSASLNQTISQSELIEFVQKQSKACFVAHKDVSRFLHASQKLGVELQDKVFSDLGVNCKCVGEQGLLDELSQMPFTNFKI